MITVYQACTTPTSYPSVWKVLARSLLSFHHECLMVYGLIWSHPITIFSVTFNMLISFKNVTISLSCDKSKSCKRDIRYLCFIDSKTPWSIGWMRLVTFGGRSFVTMKPSSETISLSSGWAEQLSRSNKAFDCKSFSFSFFQTLGTKVWNHAENKLTQAFLWLM